MDPKAILRHACTAPLLLLAACGAEDRAAASPAAPAATTAPAPAAAAAAAAAGGDFIRMRVDGVEWAADRDIFCAIDPPGMDRVLIVSGSRGPKDADEQAFNLNLSAIDGPGTVHVAGASGLTHVIQLANLDPQRVLNGGAMGFDVTVELLTLSRDPLRVEARFAGTLGSTAGAPLRIDDGHLRCSE